MYLLLLLLKVEYANYDAGTAYVNVTSSSTSKVYQALTSGGAGAGAPTHSSGDTGGYATLRKQRNEGSAGFAREDFDVDGCRHVTIAAAGWTIHNFKTMPHLY